MLMSRREDTCKKRPCPFWLRYGDNCPHFVVSDWESNEGDKYSTDDCAPKRSMKLQQQIYALLLGTRKDTNKTRNVTLKFLEALMPVQESLPAEFVEHKQIEDLTDGKDTG
jgi:hypothetical protein